MILTSIEGKIIFESRAHTVREALEEASSEGVDLRSINLRHCNLKNVKLKNCNLSHACLWGADLTGAQFDNVMLCYADCRLGAFNQTEILECNLSGSDFSGAQFHGATLRRADFSNTQFSALSILSADIIAPVSMFGAFFNYQGEWNMALQDALISKKSLSLTESLTEIATRSDNNLRLNNCS